jgi:DtxR family transcriptional regulator, Mn-dependent transcriptional regulator
MYKAEEDYLKLIFEQSHQQEYVSIKEIALKFNYTEQSVYEMIKKLQKKGLLKYVPYQGIKLVKKGLDQAIRMTRAHRIWEVFLETFLGYDWHEVHDEAEMLEHAGSEEMLKRLYEKLGSPSYCQHGNPIPNFSNSFSNPSLTCLKDVLENQSFTIKKVADDKALLLFLKDKNMRRDDVIFIDKKYENHGLIEVINTKDERVVLSLSMANMMFGDITKRS